MDHQIFLLGTNHTLVDPSALGSLPSPETLELELTAARTRGNVAGFVVLSTCNRFEIYLELATDSLDSLPIDRWFGDLPRVQLRGPEVARHLIRVAASLDSMVLGENQIHGQVKQAWQRSLELGWGGTLLHELFREALRGAREIRHRTGLGTRPVSVASLAARHLIERLGHEPARVAIVGAGKMAQKAASALAEHPSLELLFVNRTVERAAELAARFGGLVMGLDEFLTAPPPVDAVFVAARGTRPLVDAEVVVRLRQADRRLRLVDVCVPSGVDATVANLPAIELLDMNELKRRSEEHAAERRAAARAAAPLVERHVAAWTQRLQRRSLGLAGIQEQHIALAQQSLERVLDETLGQLDGDAFGRLKRRVLDLAKAHAHLHLKDLKTKAALLCT